MKEKKIFNVYAGTRKDVIHGQEVEVAVWETIDPDMGLNYEEVVSDISSSCPIRQEKARTHIRQYKVARQLGESLRNG